MKRRSWEAWKQHLEERKKILKEARKIEVSFGQEKPLGKMKQEELRNMTPQTLARAMKADPNVEGDLSAPGCNFNFFKAAGWKGERVYVGNLREKYSTEQLLTAGYSPQELRKGGCPVKDFVDMGYDSAMWLREAGYSARDLLRLEGFSSERLVAAGYPAAAVKNDNSTRQRLTEGLSRQDLLGKGISLEFLRKEGYSAWDLTGAGFSSEELVAAGYPAVAVETANLIRQLRTTGYSAQDFREACYSPQEIREVGYSVRDLLGAGYSPQELLEAGYSPQELRAVVAAVEIEEKDLRQYEEVKQRFDAVEHRNRVARGTQVPEKSAADLRGAKPGAKEALEAGYSPRELQEAGYPARDFVKMGYGSARWLREEARYSAEALVNEGLFEFTALKRAGYVMEWY